MKVANLFIDFIIICALLAASLMMLHDGNYFFSLLAAGAAVLESFRYIRGIIKGDYDSE